MYHFLWYSSSPSSSTPKSGRYLIITQTVFQAQIFPTLMLMGHFARAQMIVTWSWSLPLRHLGTLLLQAHTMIRYLHLQRLSHTCKQLFLFVTYLLFQIQFSIDYFFFLYPHLNIIYFYIYFPLFPCGLNFLVSNIYLEKLQLFLFFFYLLFQIHFSINYFFFLYPYLNIIYFHVCFPLSFLFPCGLNFIFLNIYLEKLQHSKFFA